MTNYPLFQPHLGFLGLQVLNLAGEARRHRQCAVRMLRALQLSPGSGLLMGGHREGKRCLTQTASHRQRSGRWMVTLSEAPALARESAPADHGNLLSDLTCCPGSVASLASVGVVDRRHPGSLLLTT